MSDTITETIETEDEDRTPVDERSQHSPEALAALVAEGPVTDEQVDALLAETPWAADTALPSPEPLRSDARGPELARRVAALVRRPDGADLGATLVERDAWDVVRDAHAAYRDAVGRLDSVEQERADEDAEADAVAADQLCAGEPVKLPSGTDWQVEERTRRAVVRVAAEGVKVARHAYDRVVEVERPKRPAQAVETLRAAEGAMRKVAPKAIAVVAEWLAARDLAVRVVEGQDDYRADIGLIDRDASRVLGEGRRAVGALRALIGSEHPVVTARHLSEAYEVQPPIHIREWLAEGHGGSAEVLAAIEVAEDGKVSQLARPFWHLVHPEAGRPEWRPSRLRSQ